MTATDSSSRVELRAVDCSEVEAWAREAGWELDYQQLDCGPYNAPVAGVECGSAIATCEEHNVALAAWGTPAPDTVCLFMSEAEAPVSFCGSELGDSRAAFVRAGDDVVVSWGPSGARVLAVTMFWDDICNAVAAWGREPEDVLSLRGVMRLAPGHRRSLNDAIRGALDATVDVTLAPSDLEQDLVASFVDVLVSAAEPHQQPERLPAYGAYVRRVQQHVEARLDEEIRLVDLARVAGTTPRTLQSSFKAVIGISPMRWVRVRRLDRLRRSLLSTGRNRTITSLAFEHGLTHLGRLSVEYRRLFGESPSDTRSLAHTVRPS